MPVSASGYITRSNLPSPLGNLAIVADPLWLLTGDTSSDASVTTGAGVALGQSAMKYVWADSPFVRGKQLVNAVPDNSTLDLRIACDGHGSLASALTLAASIVTAITQQMTFQVSITGDTATTTWNCYPGTYLPAFNQMYWFGYELPLYVSLPRDPTPVAGGV